MPQDHSHDYFVELCALSTSGVLSAEEWKELEEHLSGCSECLTIKAQYDHVIASTIPALAPNSGLEDHPVYPASAWSLDQAEASLMATLDRDRISPDRSPVPSSVSRQRDRLWFYAAAALFLVASACVGYRIGVFKGSNTKPMAVLGEPTVVNSRSPVGHVAGDTPATHEREEQDVARTAELHRQLQANLVEVAKLKQQKSQLEAELAERNADLDRDSRDRVEVDHQLALSQSTLQSLEDKLGLIASQNSQEIAQSQALQAQVNALNASLQEKNQEVARGDDLLQHDRDIRNLMGARDLYIAEIFDVAKTGDTQKPFGRVFYTKGKSLVFYAYDLDQQPGVKLANTFQAWGRRGPDPQHDVNLGIFYQDDQNKKRWILKFNDPATLAQIDAVFVTVEPNGKSSKPSGKPLLFTYLRMTPNHP